MKMDKDKMYKMVDGLVIIMTSVFLITVFSSLIITNSNYEVSSFPFWYCCLLIPIITRKKRMQKMKEEEFGYQLEGS